MDFSQRERLAMLIEECGEVIQAATKVLRHGWDSHHPEVADGETNKEALERELGDVMGVMHGMTTKGDIAHIPWSSFPDNWERKKKWTHHQNKGKYKS